MGLEWKYWPRVTPCYRNNSTGGLYCTKFASEAFGQVVGNFYTGGDRRFCHPASAAVYRPAGHRMVRATVFTKLVENAIYEMCIIIEASHEV